MGLSSLLAFIEQYLNKILRKVTTDYRVKLANVQPEDESRKADIRKKRLETDSTIDEFREKDGKEPFGEDWSQMPLNTYAVQMASAAKAQEQQQGMGGAFPGAEEQPGGEEQGPENLSDLLGGAGESTEGEGEESQEGNETAVGGAAGNLLKSIDDWEAAFIDRTERPRKRLERVR